MKQHPVVLALDLSIVRTGWAISDLDGTTAGAESFTPAKGQPQAIRYRNFYVWLDTQLRLLQPDTVVFEQPVCRGQGQTQDALIGLKTRMDELCAIHGIPLKGIYPSALKKAFVGDGKKDEGKDGKRRMKARCAEIFEDYDPATDAGGDIADARALTWVYANKPEVFEPKLPKKRKVRK
jgi:Holliday junction resolvasome RuvABC endonuclease subunit